MDSTHKADGSVCRGVQCMQVLHCNLSTLFASLQCVQRSTVSMRRDCGCKTNRLTCSFASLLLPCSCYAGSHWIWFAIASTDNLQKQWKSFPTVPPLILMLPSIPFLINSQWCEYYKQLFCVYICMFPLHYRSFLKHCWLRWLSRPQTTRTPPDYLSMSTPFAESINNQKTHQVTTESKKWSCIGNW